MVNCLWRQVRKKVYWMSSCKNISKNISFFLPKVYCSKIFLRLDYKRILLRIWLQSIFKFGNGFSRIVLFSLVTPIISDIDNLFNVLEECLQQKESISTSAVFWFIETLLIISLYSTVFYSKLYSTFYKPIAIWPCSSLYFGRLFFEIFNCKSVSLADKNVLMKSAILQSSFVFLRAKWNHTPGNNCCKIYAIKCN